MFYPVMIVDDEPYVRRMLRGLGHWEQNGFYIAAECINGQDALERLRAEKTPFALVVCDIRMPLMDGMRFIEIARAEFKELLFVVISAYDDFHQVRKALLMGVEDYLLKSEMTGQDVDRLLVKLRGILRSRGENRKEERMSALLQELLVYGIHRNGNAFAPDSAALLERWERRALAVGCYSYAGDDESVEESWRALTDALDGLSDARTAYASLRTAPRDGYVILGLQPDAARRPDQTLRDIHRRLCEHGERVNLGLSDVFYDPGLVGEMISDSADACSMCFLRGNGHCFTYGAPKTPDAGLSIDVLKRLQALRQALNEVPAAPLAEYRERLLGGAENAGTTDIAPLKELFLRYTYALEENVSGDAQYEEIRRRCAMGRELLDKHADFRTMEDWLYRVLKDMRVNAPPKNLVDKMIYYIDRHYQEDLSLETLSGIFNVSASHVSRLFKQYSAMNYSDYLTKARMQKALELMKSTNLRLYEVAEQVGYHSQEHFCRVFKQQIGESPKRYMSSIARQSK